MRLIDADKLPEHKFTIVSAKGSDFMRGWNHAIDTIVDNEPTVERPQGEWITDERGYVCSECGALHSDDYPFCHMCGADMRKEAPDV
jgi:hypothetical protein